jgi:tetratricopeptide (TPR) repeat protein
LRLRAGADRPGEIDERLVGVAQLASAQDLLDEGWRAADNDRYAEAVASFEQVIDRFGGTVELELRVRVLWAFEGKIWVLSQLGRWGEMDVLLGEVLMRCREASDPRLQASVALALRNRALALTRLGRFQEAVAVRDEVIARYSAEPPPDRPHAVVEALEAKAWDLLELGLAREAAAAARELLARAGSASDAFSQALVASALLSRARAMVQLREYDGVFAALDELLERFGDSDGAELRRYVAEALLERGLAYAELGLREVAVSVIDELSDRFSAAGDPGIAEVVTHGLLEKARNLGALDREKDALAAYDAVIDRCRGATSQQLRERAASALVGKVRLLAREQPGAALEIIGAWRADLETSNDQPTLLARALLTEMDVLVEAQRYTEAIEMAEVIARTFADSADPELRKSAVRALIQKVAVLWMLGRASDARFSFEEMASRFSDEALAIVDDEERGCAYPVTPDQRLRLASALLLRAIVLGETGREAEGRNALATVISEFADDEDQNMVALVTAAREAQASPPDTD